MFADHYTSQKKTFRFAIVILKLLIDFYENYHFDKL